MQDETFKYPRPAVGQIFAVSSLFFAAAAMALSQVYKSAVPTLKTLSAVYALVAGTYYLISVHRIHRILEQATDGRYPVRPWPAVLFGLVPFYNLYWLFRWTGQIALFMNGLKKEKLIDQNRYGLAMFAGYLLGVFIPGFSQIVAFAVLGNITGHLKPLLDGQALPVETGDEEFDPKTGVIVAIGGSIFMIAIISSVMTQASKELNAPPANPAASVQKS